MTSGADPGRTREKRAAGAPRELDAIVLGAGFSGLYMLYRLREGLGLEARVYEAGDGVGGTWYWNRYPGARCDSESYIYSYSFSEELEQEWEWTSKYPAQPEILRYLNHVADRFDLHRDIQLSSRVVRAHFDDEHDRWEIETEAGERARARFLITGVGCLSAANLPDLPGLERFRGAWYHTGAWPHEGVRFEGRRVGLIGTGSTGIQATPVIAAEADHLFVFQRTPNFSVPARNAPLSAERAAQIKARYREIRRQARDSFAGFPYQPVNRAAIATPEAERRAIYQELWKDGGFKFMWGSFHDLILNQASNDTAAEFIRERIREIVKDPEVAERLCPTDHPFATKRPPLDTDYFETFNRENVTLVDLRESPIVEITPEGLHTPDAFFELDTIVFATGFDAMTGSLLRIDIRGVGGRTLAEAWADGPRSYLGLQVAGFPNLFTITGPGSPSVLANMPVAIEQHVDWIGDCLTYLREKGLTRIEARTDAQDEWVGHVRDVASFTLYPKARSWYMGANIPGKKRVFLPYVGGLLPYRQRCDEVASQGYAGFELGA